MIEIGVAQGPEIVYNNVEIGVAQGPEIVYNNGVASKEPLQKVFLKNLSFGAAHRLNG